MDHIPCSHNQNKQSDDKFNIVCGDLGLGEGLKPGGLATFLQLDGIKDGSSCQCQSFISKANGSESRFSDAVATPKNKQSKSLIGRSKSKSLSSATESGSAERCEENFPTYADVPLGTSLRQQKKIYEQNLDSLLKKHGCSASVESNGSNVYRDKNENNWPGDGKMLTSDEIERKLFEAMQEVEELKIELDTCQKRLEAKYEAIAILKAQTNAAEESVQKNKRFVKEYSKRVAEEVNQLQFELEYQESSFMDSQQTWAVRFDRVCQENAYLMSCLEARSEELRRANSHKMALVRERDELVALLDVRDKTKYEKSKSQSSDEDYGTYSCVELAVLGACQCRQSNPEPCRCAHAAANLRKDIARQRDEIELYKHRRDEAYMTVDAYRKAFEEQLQKTKTLSLRFAELAVPGSSKAVKAKAAIKWLISVLNDDDLNDPVNQPAKSRTTLNGPFPNDLNTKSTNGPMSPQDLVTLLTEMLHEKSEALAHQKLAAQVLASKLHAAESKLAARGDEVFTQ
ncbi:coiled-coil domain-containing protein 125-like [Gigantopelta aegis]|uniref:coiled-coil domain-containing protein 125-like n=1 Tax=Gigantopelta aegis TaxID=1735272 RepID=UPI001B88BC20|nr:coiled-coil domain-containing protein 125-like [Gigantopelta aegis]